MSEKKSETTEHGFKKAELAKSKRFLENRDLVNALLSDDKTYTVSEVEKLIDKFKKGKVN